MVTFVWNIRKKNQQFLLLFITIKKKMCKGVAVENTHNAVLNENTAQYIGFEPFTWNKQTRPGITQSLTISNVATSIEVMETATSIRCIVSSNEPNDVIRISSIKPGKTNNCQEEKKKKKVGIDVRLSYTPLHITVKVNIQGPTKFPTRRSRREAKVQFNSTKQISTTARALYWNSRISLNALHAESVRTSHQRI